MVAEVIAFRRDFKILEIVERSESEDIDNWERLVTGIVADPVNVDSFGNIIPAHIIRIACLKFMEDYQNTGIAHHKDGQGIPILYNDKIVIVENWILRSDTVINGVMVPEGAWLLTCRIKDDDIWQDVLDGVFVGFSFEAIVKRQPIELAA